MIRTFVVVLHHMKGGLCYKNGMEWRLGTELKGRNGNETSAGLALDYLINSLTAIPRL